ncbi:lipopolysaccharide biosynthesis protein [Bisgaardia hudsonensis]
MQKNMNKHRSLIYLIFVTVLSTGLTMISAFLLAHLLNVEDRGTFQLFVTSVTYLVTIGAGGVGFAFALSMRQRQYLGWAYYFVSFLVVSALVAIIALCFFKLTTFPVLFIINVVLTAVLTITLEKSKIDANLRFYKAISLQQPILAVLLYGICYWVFGEQKLPIVLYLLTGLTCIQALLCLYYLRCINKNFVTEQSQGLSKIDHHFFRKTWLKQNLLQTFGATTVNLDKFLIVSLMGNYTLGLYTVCIAFDALLTKFINMLADYYYSGLLNKMNRIKPVLVLVGIMGISAIVIVPLLSEPIVRFFFTEKYLEVAPILVWFIVNSIIAGLSWVLSQNMLILGKQILLFTRQVISILVLVGLFYYFSELGLYGVAYALIGASLTRLVISIVYYFKYPILN